MIPKDNPNNRTGYKETNNKVPNNKVLNNKAPNNHPNDSFKVDDLYKFDESLFTDTNLTRSDLMNTQHPHQADHNNMSADNMNALITFNHITYFLYLLSFFTAGLIWLVPIVMNYLRRHEAEGTWLATHFDWQIKTFWYSIIAVAISVFIMIFSSVGLGVGLSALTDGNGLALGSGLLLAGSVFLIIWAVIWHFYRIVKGWIALSNKKPIQ